MTHLPVDEDAQVAAVSGCCLLARREVWSTIGPLDEEIPGFRATTSEQRARFLEVIAANLEAIKAPLVACAVLESGLPEGRIAGEVGRNRHTHLRRSERRRDQRQHAGQCQDGDLQVSVVCQPHALEVKAASSHSRRQSTLTVAPVDSSRALSASRH